MIDPDIKQRIGELPRQYRDFIYSGYATEAANVLGSAEDLTPEQIKLFESSILLYLLFFIDKSDLTEILMNEGVPAKEAAGLVFALEKSLPSFAKQAETSLLETDSFSSLESEIATTEHDLAALQNVRTMAHDMKEAKTHPITPHTTNETTHQSSQADLLRQIETLAAPSNVPRWDTEK